MCITVPSFASDMCTSNRYTTSSTPLIQPDEMDCHQFLQGKLRAFANERIGDTFSLTAKKMGIGENIAIFWTINKPPGL